MLCALVILLTVAAQESADAKFWAMVQEHVPTEGVVEGVYVTSNGSEHRVAYDFKTGAWLHVNGWMMAQGADTGGRRFAVSPTTSKVEFYPTQERDTEAFVLSNFIPATALAMLSEQRTMVQRVEEHDQGFRVFFRLSAVPDLATRFVLEVDRAASVTRIALEADIAQPSEPIQYSTRSAWLVETVARPPRTLREVVEERPSDQFSRGRAQRLHEQALTTHYEREIAAGRMIVPKHHRCGAGSAWGPLSER